jgi:hypothetical protein
MSLDINLTGVEKTSNKKTTLTDNSDTFYPTQKAVKTAVDSKFNTPTGTTAQYLRGDGSLDTFPTIPDVTGLQSKAVVVSTNQTAVNDGSYTVVANSTFTDPSPVEGKGYRVFVRNGTATINSVGYTEGTTILRLFHSGGWTSYVSLPDSIFVPTTRTINGYDLSANRTLTPSDIGVVSGTIIVTSGTSFTTPSNITTSTKFDIILVGGGGGGAGINTSNTTAGGGGGGAVCQVLSLTGLNPSTSYTCAIGAGGAGGASATNGTDGGDTTLTIGVTTYTAEGGGGGLTGAGAPLGGDGGTATNGTRNLTGQKGMLGIVGGTLLSNGRGGDAPLGQGFGGIPTTSNNSNGNNATNNGGGGGGAKGLASVGGNGSNGIIIAKYYS